MSPELRALVVGEDPTTCRAVADELAELCLVVEASSYDAALIVLDRDGDIDAVVCDHGAATELDGLALLAEVQRRFPEARRVLLVGEQVDQRVEAAIASGLAWWVIAKPWRSGEVLTAVAGG
ncbi:MAG: hypothetical protein V2A73_05550 [Pseudomonadota bacterium]